MFSTTIDTINSQIQDRTDAIASLEQQLQQEREALHQLQNHLQAFQTAAAAALAAKEQVAKAVQMVKAIAPENLPELQSEINSLFVTPELPAVGDESTSTGDDTVTDKGDIPETSTTIEVEVSEPTLSYQELMQCDYEVLKAIASDLNLPNGSKARVCKGLKGTITQADIEKKIAEFKESLGM